MRTNPCPDAASGRRPTPSVACMKRVALPDLAKTQLLPPVILAATHEDALDFVSLDVLKQHALDFVN